MAYDFSNLFHSFVSLIFGFLSYLVINAFPRWHEEDDEAGDGTRQIQPFPSPRLSYTALTTIAVAALSALGAAIWQHLASAAMVKVAGNVGPEGAVSAHVGVWALAFVWISALVLLGLLVVQALSVLSIRLLSSVFDPVRTSDDEEEAAAP
jgi:hypothetical protein